MFAYNETCCSGGAGSASARLAPRLGPACVPCRQGVQPVLRIASRRPRSRRADDRIRVCVRASSGGRGIALPETWSDATPGRRPPPAWALQSSLPSYHSHICSWWQLHAALSCDVCVTPRVKHGNPAYIVVFERPAAAWPSSRGCLAHDSDLLRTPQACCHRQGNFLSRVVLRGADRGARRGLPGRAADCCGCHLVPVSVCVCGCASHSVGALEVAFPTIWSRAVRAWRLPVCRPLFSPLSDPSSANSPGRVRSTHTQVGAIADLTLLWI